MADTKKLEQPMSAAAKKEERAREGVVAMREYEAEKARIDANTQRLRALRLAKQAARDSPDTLAKERLQAAEVEAESANAGTREASLGPRLGAFAWLALSGHARRYCPPCVFPGPPCPMVSV